MVYEGQRYNVVDIVNLAMQKYKIRRINEKEEAFEKQVRRYIKEHTVKAIDTNKKPQYYTEEAKDRILKGLRDYFMEKSYSEEVRTLKEELDEYKSRVEKLQLSLNADGKWKENTPEEQERIRPQVNFENKKRVEELRKEIMLTALFNKYFSLNDEALEEDMRIGHSPEITFELPDEEVFRERKRLEDWRNYIKEH